MSKHHFLRLRTNISSPGRCLPVLAFVALCSLLPLARVTNAQQESSVKISAKADAAAGKPIFERYCAPCHGISGGGGRGPRLNRPHLPHAPTDAALRAVITDGIAPGMPDAWYLSDEEIANVAAHIRALGKMPGEIVPGDPSRGAAVYARSGCSACHIHVGQGVGFGPDLTDVGERRNASYIRQAVSNPASALPEGFLMVTAVTSAGKSINGVRLNEDSFTIQIKEVTGRIYSFRKRDLKELKKETGQTPMPSFEGILSPADLQDLVAFLAASRETP
jgi:cytochrome c oxidase cbb3-type subunit 3